MVLIGITCNVGIIIIVVSGNIPVVDFRQGIWICSVRGIETCRRTVVNDITVVLFILHIRREYEVTCRFEEVFRSIIWSLVYIVGIYISATFTIPGIDKVHLDDAMNRTVVDDFLHLLVLWIDDFLYVLNLQRIARCDTYHVLGGTIVAVLEFGNVRSVRIDKLLDVVFLILLVRYCRFLTFFVIPGICKLSA